MTYWVIAKQKDNVYLGADTTSSIPRWNTNIRNAYGNQEILKHGDTVKLLNRSYLTKENKSIAIGICISGNLQLRHNGQLVEHIIEKFLSTIQKNKNHFESAASFIEKMVLAIKKYYVKKQEICADEDLFKHMYIAVALSFENGSFSLSHYNGYYSDNNIDRISKNKDCSDKQCNRIEYYTNEIGYLEMNLPSSGFPDVLREYIGNSANTVVGDDYYKFMQANEQSTTPFLYDAIYPHFTTMTINSQFFTSDPKQFIGRIISTYRNRSNKNSVSDKIDFLHLANGKIVEYDPAPRNNEWSNPINFAQTTFPVHVFNVDHDPSRPYNPELQKHFSNQQQLPPNQPSYIPYESNQTYTDISNFQDVVTRPNYSILEGKNLRQTYENNPYRFSYNASTNPNFPTTRPYDEAEDSFDFFSSQ